MFTQVPLQQYTSAAAARVLPFHTVAARETRAHTSSKNMRTSSICCPLTPTLYTKPRSRPVLPPQYLLCTRCASMLPKEIDGPWFRILTYRARGRRARADHATWPVSLLSNIERRCWDTLNPGVYSGIGIQHMPSATNLISFLRSVESHRSRELSLKFAGEVLWRPILFLENTLPVRSKSLQMGP